MIKVYRIFRSRRKSRMLRSSRASCGGVGATLLSSVNLRRIVPKRRRRGVLDNISALSVATWRRGLWREPLSSSIGSDGAQVGSAAGRPWAYARPRRVRVGRSGADRVCGVRPAVVACAKRHFPYLPSRAETGSRGRASHIPAGGIPPSTRRIGPGPSAPLAPADPVVTLHGHADPFRASRSRRAGSCEPDSDLRRESATMQRIRSVFCVDRIPRRTRPDGMVSGSMRAAPYIPAGKTGENRARHRQRSRKHLPRTRQARYGNAFLLASPGSPLSAKGFFDKVRGSPAGSGWTNCDEPDLPPPAIWRRGLLGRSMVVTDFRTARHAHRIARVSGGSSRRQKGVHLPMKASILPTIASIR